MEGASTNGTLGSAPSLQGIDGAADDFLKSTGSRDLVVAWLRFDLRVHDNPVIARAMSAARRGAVIVFAHCHDPRVFNGVLRVSGLPKMGTRRARFVWEALSDLNSRLVKAGSRLISFPGKPEVHLPQLCGAWRSQGNLRRATILVQGCLTHEERQAEEAVEQALHASGARLLRVWGHALYHIDDLPYKDVAKEIPHVFAPFGRAVRGHFHAADAGSMQKARSTGSALQPRDEWETPGALPGEPTGLAETAGAVPLTALEPECQSDDSRAAIHFEGGESAGLQRLEEFVKMDLRTYKDTRNQLIGKRFSSKLSPWIAIGCVSAKRIVSAIREFERTHTHARPTPSTAHFVSEFSWRDYEIFLALKYGRSLFLRGGPGRVDWKWNDDKALFNRFLTGRIGMPLIDAAMRELRETGFSSNRARQFLASYLSVELKLDWRLGAETFETFLIDYDVHANWVNWARAAGVCGQGFGHGGSRWFNLAEEVARFDKDGKFVYLWVPELRQVDLKFIHRPWQMSAQQQEASNCVIGRDYPLAPDTDSKRSLDGQKVDDALLATTRDGKMAVKGKGKRPSSAAEGSKGGKAGGSKGGKAGRWTRRSTVGAQT